MFKHFVDDNIILQAKLFNSGRWFHLSTTKVIRMIESYYKMLKKLTIFHVFIWTTFNVVCGYHYLPVNTKSITCSKEGRIGTTRSRIECGALCLKESSPNHGFCAAFTYDTTSSACSVCESCKSKMSTSQTLTPSNRYSRYLQVTDYKYSENYHRGKFKFWSGNGPMVCLEVGG